MGNIIKINDFLDNIEFFLEEAKNGKIFIYPTDTLYGLGGIYSLQNIDKIYKIKERDTKKPLSVIAPNWHRIVSNFDSIDVVKFKSYYDKFHGVTFICSINKNSLLKGFNGTLGVRIIKHVFQGFVERLGLPFITTSANLSGYPNIINISDLDSQIYNSVDYIIDGGSAYGKPSVMIDNINNIIINRQ